MRVRRWSGLTIALLTIAGVATATTSHAATTIRGTHSQRSTPRITAKVAPAPLLTVHAVTASDVQGEISVSGNGIYVLDRDNGHGIGALYNAETDKQIGSEIGPPTGATNPLSADLIGVDDSGVVFGNADRMVNGSDIGQSFTWSNGSAGWLGVPPADTLGKIWGCGDDNSVGLGDELYSVNSQGEAVGADLGTCDGASWQLAVKVSGSDQWGPTGTYTTNSGEYHPVLAYSIDDAGEVLGTVSTQDEAPMYEWSSNGTGEVKSLADLTAHPNAYATTANTGWWGTDFIGGEMTASGGQSVWEGGQAFDVLDATASTASKPGQYGAQALGLGDEVGGEITSALVNQGDPSAAIWYRGGKITLLSKLTHKTSITMIGVAAFDNRGDIFGVGQGKTSNVIYEARVPNPPPTVSIKTPKSGHSYKKGSTLKASFTCHAGKLGTLKSCKGSVADHHKISTSKVGSHSFTVTAVDKDGEKTVKKVHYKIKK